MKKKELLKRISGTVEETCRVQSGVPAACGAETATAARWMAAAIARGRKVMTCGNGGSAADAQHVAAELVGRFMKERPPFAAVALTTDTSVITSVGNDYGFDDVFARQVEGVGRPGDVLLIFTTSGNSPNVIKAARAARARGIRTIGVSGKGGGRLAGHVDLLIAAPSERTPRIQEAHGLIGHLLCEFTELLLADRS
ncbi:MAG: SIS domain-containing protein [bacterium]